MAKKVIVYTTQTCPYCHFAMDFLKENNVEFEAIDVSKDHDAARRMVEKSGQMGVPVIEVDGEMIIGFDKERLKQLLNL
ncbi:MAG: glutaredoxin domain-containing protein [Nanoarchaeota archaeon]|nr:glutaredoxin domain-containing protein [Nanoarchaeota archaeon]